MNGLRLARRGIAETYEHLFAYALATLIWWACALSIVLGPAGTMLLFIQTDPRNGTLRERPPFRESLNLLRANLVRGWRLGIIVLPPVALLVFNLFVYLGNGRFTDLLKPFWLVLLLLGIPISLCAFALYATEPVDAVRVLRVSIAVVGSRLPTTIGLVVALVIMGVISTLLVLPALLFLPAIIASMFNRFALESLEFEIPDPGEPTPERQIEARREPNRLRKLLGE